MAVIDWTDPCERAKALRDAYFNLLSGAAAQTIAYSDGNQTRSISYHNKTLDLNVLRDAYLAAEAECLGLPPSKVGGRYAITGGALDKGD